MHTIPPDSPHRAPRENHGLPPPPSPLQHAHMVGSAFGNTTECNCVGRLSKGGLLAYPAWARPAWAARHMHAAPSACMVPSASYTVCARSGDA